jgi:putative ABC transport system permease protein
MPSGTARLLTVTMTAADRPWAGGLRRRWSVEAARSRLSLRDLWAEATAGIVQRPARSVLTVLGTVLGVGTFVAVLGLTATASAQIGSQFNVLTATTVTVTDVRAEQASNEGQRTTPLDFPRDADQRVDRLNGVVASGVWWQVSIPGTPVIAALPGELAGSDRDVGSSTPVFAASPGLFQAMGATLSTGVFFNNFHQQTAQNVCVIGSGLASQMGITQLYDQPAVFINGTAFTVVGIMKNSAEYPQMLLGMIIPSSTALKLYRLSPSLPAQMLIRTRLGAAQLVASQAPEALDPDDPGALSAVAPPTPRQLRAAVNTDLAGLFFALAAISLVIGTIGIANTTLVAVLERTGEIGLRRALGALRRHIAAQFLAESTALGLLGGLVGTALAVGVVVVFALARHWTAVLDPATVLPAPFIGAATGLLAGLYPALRAATIEPLAALRR